MICIGASCANIVPPTGGKKDKTPPKLVSVTPADSQLNTRPKRIEFHFNEYITLSNPSTEVQISPILPIQPNVTAINKKVVIKIADTLLLDSTTYRISFGNAIQDLHEGNIFTGYSYTFSTGSFFDSLQISGDILNAATGMPDTGIFVTLYSAARPDSAVVKEKPQYVAKADAKGHFSIKGLPNRKFRIYALKDANGNLIYDGGKEWIGFIDRTIRPGDTNAAPILIRVFPEIFNDTGKQNSLQNDKLSMQNARPASVKKPSLKEAYGYVVDADTSDIKKRTKEITKPVDVAFNKKTTDFNTSKIILTYDSTGIAVEAITSITLDTAHNVLKINTPWLDNTVYTLRLLKGFAKDSAGAETMPSRYSFRTKRDEDYGNLQINLPARYLGGQYLLQVVADKDTLFTKVVQDTVIALHKLQPGKYVFRIIADKNRNGKWDTGDLFAKIQPEEVIPYKETINLKAGWDHIIDFEQKEKPKKPVMNTDKTPK